MPTSTSTLFEPLAFPADLGEGVLNVAMKFLRAEAGGGRVSVMGIYNDMTPVRLSFRRTYVNFNNSMTDAMSAQRHIDKLHAPITVTYGALETPDFQRESS